MHVARRVLLRGTSLVAVVSLLSACTSALPSATPGPKPTAVSPSRGVTARIGTATVTIPAGAVTGAGRLSVVASQPPSSAAGTTPIGQGITATLTGATLTGAATVTFAVPPSAVDVNHIPVIVWQDGAGGWRWLPGTWQPGAHTISATTDHFSSGFLGSFDVAGFVRDHKTEVTNYLTGRSGVQQPTCGDERAARAQVSVASDGGDSVKWCLGVLNGRTVLRVANNRRTYMSVTYPKSWKVIDGGHFGISLEALVRSSAGVLDRVTAPRGGDVRLVSGGDTLTLALPTGGSARVTAQMDFTAWAITGIALGMSIYGAVAGSASRLIGASSAGSFERFVAHVAETNPGKGWADAWKSCTEGLSSELTDHPFQAVSAASTVTPILKAAWTCVPALMKADLSSVGLGMWGVGVVLAAVGFAVSAVLTALNLILTGIREIWDNVASFGGHSNPIYAIVLRSLAPVCDPAALFKAAYTAEGFNPNDPSYAQLTAVGDGPGAHGARCVGQWALAGISRPNVGTTDGATLFRQGPEGTWHEIGGGGMWLVASCQLVKMGVPASVAHQLAPGVPQSAPGEAGC